MARCTIQWHNSAQCTIPTQFTGTIYNGKSKRKGKRKNKKPPEALGPGSHTPSLPLSRVQTSQSHEHSHSKSKITVTIEKCYPVHSRHSHHPRHVQCAMSYVRCSCSIQPFPVDTPGTRHLLPILAVNLLIPSQFFYRHHSSTHHGHHGRSLSTANSFDTDTVPASFQPLIFPTLPIPDLTRAIESFVYNTAQSQ